MLHHYFPFFSAMGKGLGYSRLSPDRLWQRGDRSGSKHRYRDRQVPAVWRERRGAAFSVPEGGEGVSAVKDLRMGWWTGVLCWWFGDFSGH